MTVAASTTPLVAFVGGGNMAAALIAGLLRNGWSASAIAVSEPVSTRRDWLNTEFAGIQVVADSSALPAVAAAWVLAVKPQQVGEVLPQLPIASGALLVSIAAGVPLAALGKALPQGVSLVRTMPNTPALLGAGITGLYAPAATSEAHRALAERILAMAGRCVWVSEESQLDAVTAVSGSGPAYFFYLVEAMEVAGVQLGLPAATARELAVHTALGAGRMLVESGQDPATLRANVTSKGGTTEAALQHLAAQDFMSTVGNALGKANDRAEQLGRLFIPTP